METYLTEAIILNREDFREYDARVTLYSLDKGKIDLVVRGAKRIESKLAAHLEPFSLSDIMVVRGRRFDYIGGAVSRTCRANIKNNLDKINSAGEAIRVFNKLIKNSEKDKIVFNLLEEFLEVLDNCFSDAQSLKAKLGLQLFNSFFILKLLTQLGFKPELYDCVVCRGKIKPDGNLFDLSKGGLVCADCQAGSYSFRGRASAPSTRDQGPVRSRLTISDNCIKVLRLAVKSDLEKLTRLKMEDKTAREVVKVVGDFLEYLI